MPKENFTYKDLIDAYLMLRAYSHIQEDNKWHQNIPKYHKHLLEKLEQAFGTPLTKWSFDGADHKLLMKKMAEKGLDDDNLGRGPYIEIWRTLPKLWRLFELTVQSFETIRTPLEYTLEMPQYWGTNEPIVNSLNDISVAGRAFRQKCRDLLYLIYEHTFGNTERIVTLDEMKQLGFDPTLEPSENDYYEAQT